jgi:GxxExxY protein
MNHDLEKPFAQEGYDFMGALFEVPKVLGGGLLEEIYQESLEIELGLRGISYQSQHALTTHYKHVELKKKYIPDLIVADHVVVELKSVRELTSDHEAQLLNYMRLTRQPVGYLVNFAPIVKVEWKRFLLSEFVPQ